MPWGTVDRLPDNPGQRDTEGHAVDLLSSGVVQPPLDLHCEISMVLIGYPTKATSLASIRSRFAKDPQTAVTEFAAVMNDGHSGRHLIRSGHIPCPETFRAKVYTALDHDAAQTLYDATDSPNAVKTKAHDLQSALHIAKVELISKPHPGAKSETTLVSRCASLGPALDLAIAAACGSLKHRGPKYLALADRRELPEGLRPYQHHKRLKYLRAVDYFRGAIEALDRLNPKPKQLPRTTPEIAAALTILHRYPKEGPAFFKELAENIGTQDKGHMDAIFIAHNLEARLAERRNLKPTVRSQRYFCGLLAAFEAWAELRTFPASDFKMFTDQRVTAVIARFNPELRNALTEALTPPPSPRPRQRPYQPPGNEAPLSP